MVLVQLYGLVIQARTLRNQPFEHGAWHATQAASASALACPGYFLLLLPAPSSRRLPTPQSPPLLERLVLLMLQMLQVLVPRQQVTREKKPGVGAHALFPFSWSRRWMHMAPRQWQWQRRWRVGDSVFLRRGVLALLRRHEQQRHHQRSGCSRSRSRSRSRSPSPTPDLARSGEIRHRSTYTRG